MQNLAYVDLVHISGGNKCSCYDSSRTALAHEPGYTTLQGCADWCCLSVRNASFFQFQGSFGELQEGECT